MIYHYRTQGTCSQELSFELREGRMHDVSFLQGCRGNLKAIALLAEGMEATALAERFRELECGEEPTSCGDQLAIAIETALSREKVSAKGSCGCNHAPGSCGGSECGCAAGSATGA